MNKHYNTLTIHKAIDLYNTYIELKKQIIKSKIQYKEEIIIYMATQSISQRIYISPFYCLYKLRTRKKNKQKKQSQYNTKLFDYIEDYFYLLKNSDMKYHSDIAIIEKIINEPAPQFFISTATARRLINLGRKYANN